MQRTARDASVQMYSNGNPARPQPTVPRCRMRRLLRALPLPRAGLGSAWRDHSRTGHDSSEAFLRSGSSSCVPAALAPRNQLRHSHRPHRVRSSGRRGALHAQVCALNPSPLGCSGWIAAPGAAHFRRQHLPLISYLCISSVSLGPVALGLSPVARCPCRRGALLLGDLSGALRAARRTRRPA